VHASSTAAQVHSLDGRVFHGEVSPDLPLLVGDCVVLTREDGGTLLGQVLEKTPGAGGATGVSGPLRATLADDGAVGHVVPRPFAAAALSVARPEVVGAVHAWAGADMPVGTTVSGSDEAAPAALRRRGFNRHTFLCGQSGSGKTYTLGVILEHLLAATRLRIVVVDPNADYVGLGRVRPDADPAEVSRLVDADVRVLSAGAVVDSEGPDRLAVGFRELSTAAKAAVLRVDPLRDREEYNDLLRILQAGAAQDEIETFVDSVSHADGGVTRAVVQRIQNLGALEWDIWARGEPSLVAAVEKRDRCLVLDVSSCAAAAERYVAAVALLDHLWDRKTERDPVLIVIDEAHNVCPAHSEDPLQALATERLIQIAAEGRKYGLWLLLATQQPGKIHPNVLSQCDNIVVLRMNSAADLASLGEIFGAVPPQMLAQSAGFRQGEMLLAGGFVAAPVLATIGHRVTVEGGGDVAVPLR
jgi:DNA helicase HerA-like ATPase